MHALSYVDAYKVLIHGMAVLVTFIIGCHEYQHTRDPSQYKDYLYNGNPYICKTASLY